MTDPSLDRGGVAEGIVLTGGASRRMGRDKALLPVDGVPLALVVASALRQAGVSPVVAVGGDLAALALLGLDAVADPRQGSGPLGGIVTALERTTAGVVVVVACDLVDLTPAVVADVVAGLGAHDAAMARSDRLEPLLAAWRPAPCVGPLRAAFEAGVRAVHRALEGLDVVEVAVPVAAVRNLNRPEDVRPIAFPRMPPSLAPDHQPPHP